MNRGRLAVPVQQILMKVPRLQKFGSFLNRFDERVGDGHIMTLFLTVGTVTDPSFPLHRHWTTKSTQGNGIPSELDKNRHRAPGYLSIRAPIPRQHRHGWSPIEWKGNEAMYRHSVVIPTSVVPVG